MWSSCHPKSDEDMRECAELGKSLNRLSQPTILTLLACSDEPLHGYVIVQQAASSPMFGGKKPDATGIYRALKRMEEAELVTSEWDVPKRDPPSAVLADRQGSLLPAPLDRRPCLLRAHARRAARPGRVGPWNRPARRPSLFPLATSCENAPQNHARAAAPFA